MFSYSRQALEHETNHANSNHRLAMIQADLIIAAEPARLVEPTKSSLYDPPLGQHLETLGSGTSAHDLQPEFAEGTKLLHPLNQSSQVAAVGPEVLQSPIGAYQELDQALGGIAVLHCGGGDHNRQDQSQGVHRHMAFAPRHL